MRGWAAQEAGVQLGIGCCHDRGLELAKEYCSCIGVSSFEDMDLEGFRLECRAHRGTSAGQTSRPVDFMGFVVMGCGRYALVGYAEDDEDFVICCNRPEQRKCTSINQNVLRVCFAVML